MLFLVLSLFFGADRVYPLKNLLLVVIFSRLVLKSRFRFFLVIFQKLFVCCLQVFDKTSFEELLLHLILELVNLTYYTLKQSYIDLGFAG